ncbi:TldD/PmbA family protein [bacterium]|nr:TldD/PmbA family protein [bacterium]
MKSMIEKIINKLNGIGTFSDIRITKTDQENIYFERGNLKNVSNSLDEYHIGVRVLIKGTWGFASSTEIKEEKIDQLIEKAVKNAKEGSLFKDDKIDYIPQKPFVGEYIFVPEKDPFKMDLFEKIEYMQKIAKNMVGREKIVHSMLFAHFYKQEKYYANTEGTYSHTILYDVRPSMMVISSDGKGVQTRTYPGHMPGRRGGFESFEKFNFFDNSEKIIKEAVDLLDAPYITEKNADIIIGGSQLALQLHESVGHATESDRIFGMELSYAGKTFVKPEYIGNFKYGSDILTIYSDAGDKRGLGYHPVDDEGIPSHRVNIIKNGILVDQQTSRFTAQKLGLEPSSNMKATNAGDFPLIRMTNLCIEPVKGSLEELIRSTEKGYLIDYTKTWSIDDNRNNFQFTTEIGWKIENGELKSIVKEPTYYGITKDFWNSCDAICGEDEWTMHGTFYCGKGEPGQLMHLSHGVSPARFKNIPILPKE